ncbi:hypothetical protein SCHPADRAFT_931591 [Schizopora paradoxa]|uniref:FAD/NAD(P)-binding domain-containing protein n=1 Tax=Schizopora paradoxa TaxID=27342 RepID=A0A0H2RAB6_9AGAM|nr:hypothetical protein SCHPADRAFT_931591 [Schizopora paradoxa]
MMETLTKIMATALLPVTAMAFWRMGSSLLTYYIYKRFTVLKELMDIGKARVDDERIAGTAVICGGSIAGLWAARICADHFEDVVVVEPEAWIMSNDGSKPIYDERGDKIGSTEHRPRTRVHQYFAAHVFWNLSLLALRRLFPDFEKELLKRDGKIVEAELNCYTWAGRVFRSSKHWYPEGEAPQIFSCSRDAYERLLRCLVMKSSSRIRQVTGTVTGVKPFADDHSKIEKVVVSKSDSDGTKLLEIPAALVVDCTGATQAGFKWIKRLCANTNSQEIGSDRWNKLIDSYNIHGNWKAFDFFVPPEIRAVVSIPGGYDNYKWLYTFIPFPGCENKLFLINRIEGHRIRYSFYGWGNPPIPESPEGILDYMATVKSDVPVPQWAFDLLSQLLKVNEIQVYTGKMPLMNWVHYEKAPFVPSNFVAIGDAVMKVNPTFGQGCTKACIGAIVLDNLLRSPRYAQTRKVVPGFSSEFFKIHHDKIVDAWNGTKPMDYMFSTTTPVKGENLDDEKISGTFALLLLEVATEDSDVDALLCHMRQFIAPAANLYAPWVFWRVLKFCLNKKIRKLWEETV